MLGSQNLQAFLPFVIPSKISMLTTLFVTLAKWQEISIAANVAQKEIGKYIKILGEALQLSQPINSNSISVHMPRFCTLLQLNKSAQVPELHENATSKVNLILFENLAMSL